ncbi:THO complex subunit 3 [Cichlidogyrus casuarinus]|uniref:THO complex subunit 3 n=1 Tax=Cichlidogyrus casuarinus TaxID=1844966 RepID=A0ABD2PX49_9PLAT
MKKQASLQTSTVNAICLSFSKNGEYFAVGSNDSLVTIWDTKDFVCTRTIGRLEWPVRCIGFCSNSKLIASAGEDHFIDIACVETGKQVHRINNPGSATFVLAWNPGNGSHTLAYVVENKYDKEQGNLRFFITSLSKNSSETSVPI